MVRHEELAHGVVATTVISLVGIEDMGLKVGTALLMAVLSTLVSALVRHVLGRVKKHRPKS